MTAGSTTQPGPALPGAEVGDEPGYLTRDSILQRIAAGPAGSRLIERGDQLERAQPDLGSYVGNWYCDLHLGPQAYLSSNKHLSRLDWGEDLAIGPGEFGLLITEEEVNLPSDLAAFISLRFSIAIRGLVNISGRHVDPGYRGRLVFSVYNAGTHPVMMKRGDPIFMITFAKLDHLAPGKANPTIGKIESISAEWMANVHGPPVSLPRLDERVKALEIQFRVFIGILATVGAAAVAAFLGWFLR